MDDLAASGGVDIVVATPGRLLDLAGSKAISLVCITMLVLDEADRMLAMGFAEQLDQISKQVRPDRQTVLFSATFPGRLRTAAAEWFGQESSDKVLTIRCSTLELDRSPVPNDKRKREEEETKVETKSQSIKEDEEDEEEEEEDETKGVVGEEKEGNENGEEVTGKAADRKHNQTSLTVSSSIVQSVHVCAEHKKPRLVLRHISNVRTEEKEKKCRQPGHMLIFVTRIKTGNFLIETLRKHGVEKLDFLHGKLPQSERESVLANFRAGKVHTLVSTDIAARGIHIKNLKYVVNYDFPANLETYCHRIGRTGRQGEVGHAFSLLPRCMTPLVPDLIALLQSNNQVVEPNLLALVPIGDGGRVQTSEDFLADFIAGNTVAAPMGNSDDEEEEGEDE